jgi:hypothetical protein
MKRIYKPKPQARRSDSELGCQLGKKLDLLSVLGLK